MTVSEHIKLHHKGKVLSEETKLKMSGENHPATVLSNRDVLEIRKLYKTGKYTQQQLMDIYGVNVELIVTGQTWKNIDTSDCTTKFYKSKGERNSNAKLTNDIVLEIRKFEEVTNASLKEISQKFKINMCTARDITSRRTWKHI